MKYRQICKVRTVCYWRYPLKGLILQQLLRSRSRKPTFHYWYCFIDMIRLFHFRIHYLNNYNILYFRLSQFSQKVCQIYRIDIDHIKGLYMFCRNSNKVNIFFALCPNNNIHCKSLLDLNTRWFRIKAYKRRYGNFFHHLCKLRHIYLHIKFGHHFHNNLCID